MIAAVTIGATGPSRATCASSIAARSANELSASLEHASTAAVWEARQTRADAVPAKVLVIGVGGGIDVLMALLKGAASVIGAEVNPAMLALLTDRYREYSGNLAGDPRVTLVNAEGRAFVRSSQDRFDVIQLSGVDTYAALSSGAYSVAEAYLYTVEAFADFLERLNPGGFVQVSRFYVDPPRETLRLAAIAAQALRSRGVAEPWRHILIMSGALWASVVVSERVIEEGEVAAVRAFAEREGYAMAFDPLRPSDKPFDHLLRGSDAERAEFQATYPYRVDPVTDDAPFFFNYFRWSNVPSIFGMTGRFVYTMPVPVGHVILLLTLLVTAVLATIGIRRPSRQLAITRNSERRRFATYFACLGIAYLFIELAFLQRLTLFLGHPTYALSVVLAGMLISSGLGSAVCRSVRVSPRVVLPIAAIAAVVSGIAAGSILPQFLGLPFAGRVALALAMITPVGFLMGMPFPIGLERLRAVSAHAVPWGFGVNAFFTVIASTLAVILAMDFGFTTLFVIGALCYGLAALVLPGDTAAEDAAANAAVAPAE